MLHAAPKRPSKTQIKVAWILEHVQKIERLQPEDFSRNSHILLGNYQKLFRCGRARTPSWGEFFRDMNGISGAVNDADAARVILDTYIRFLQSSRSSQQRANHGEKRIFIMHIRLHDKPPSVTEAIRAGCPSLKLPSGTLLKFIRRDRRERRFGPGTQMYDIASPHSKCGAVVNEDNGFMIVPATDSILFYSGEHSKFTADAVQLIVIRDVGGMTHPTSDSVIFYRWLASVVDFGCYGRRNQRPQHPGHMAQVALTLGARHVPACRREVGWGVSYYRKLSQGAKISHDEDVIAASGIFWSMIMCTMPTEVTGGIVEILKNRGIPHMATRWVAPGKGFRLQLENKHYVFPNVSRSPPEVYLTKGYSAYAHIDACYAPLAFNLNVDRQQLDTITARNNTKIPPYGGANFVDAELGIVIINAIATMFAFRPTNLHGTTVTGGTCNSNLTFAFSRKIGDALAELEASQKCHFGEVTWGAGKGNLDFKQPH